MPVVEYTFFALIGECHSAHAQSEPLFSQMQREHLDLAPAFAAAFRREVADFDEQCVKGVRIGVRRQNRFDRKRVAIPS